MTGDELNQYILHYLQEDKTKSAIMLTGEWGSGKSYYVQNKLIPYLEKEENGSHNCVVISLYGLNSLTDVSRSIYLECRATNVMAGAMKKMMSSVKVSPEGKVTGKIFAKTILKGISGRFGFELNASESELDELYRSVDLSLKLLVFEDIERTQIDLSAFMGYVNSLVEQDGAKVLLVANESEIRQRKDTNSEEDDPFANGLSGINKMLTEQNTAEQNPEEKNPEYLKAKEKIVSDTLELTDNMCHAIKQIISSFEDTMLNQFATDDVAKELERIMSSCRSHNLRSFIFACQKTADIYRFIRPLGNIDNQDFLKTIFCGVVVFSLKVKKSGKIPQWYSSDASSGVFSLKYGNNKFPLFHFCFDYIVNHSTRRINQDEIMLAMSELKKLRTYDQSKTQNDPELVPLLNMWCFEDNEVMKSIASLRTRLNNPDDISFYDYNTLALRVIEASHLLEMDLSDIKDQLVNNLRGRGNDLVAEMLFSSPFSVFSDGESIAEKVSLEYNEIINAMRESLNLDNPLSPNFDYSPEQISKFHSFVSKEIEAIRRNRSFASRLDMPRMIDLYFHCTPAQMDDFRKIFLDVYSPYSSSEKIFSIDKPCIEQLLSSVQEGVENRKIGKMQRLQCKWFIEELKKILQKL